MIRVIASDYDGTFGTHLGIPAENIEAVRRWQKAGNIFCVLTGREPLSAIDVLKQFGGVYDYLLACSGAAYAAQPFIDHRWMRKTKFSTWKSNRPPCCRRLPPIR